MSRAPLTPASVGVAVHADDRTRFGLIHRPESNRFTVGAQKRQAYKISCGPPIKSARAVDFGDGDTTAEDWCPKCWDVGDREGCDVGLRRGPMSPWSESGRRATPYCQVHGDLTRAHVDYGTARDVRDEHLRAGGGLS